MSRRTGKIHNVTYRTPHKRKASVLVLLCCVEGCEADAVCNHRA